MNFYNYFCNSLNQCLHNIVMNKKKKVSPLIIFVFYSPLDLPFSVLKFNIYLNLILKYIFYFNFNIKKFFFTDLQSPFQTKSFAMSAKSGNILTNIFDLDLCPSKRVTDVPQCVICYNTEQ